MNKHLSVLALYARNSFLRLLSLMAAMGILEAVLYVLHWNRVDREQPPLPAAVGPAAGHTADECGGVAAASVPAVPQ